MGKLVFKMLVMLAIVIGISNYVLYIKTGKTPFTDTIELPTFSKAKLNSLNPEKKRQAYKWIDENGVTHYSSEAPAQQVNAEILQVDPQQNLIQSVKLADKKSTSPSSTDAKQTLPAGNPYNPETIHKLINDAKAVQDTLNKRYEELDNH